MAHLMIQTGSGIPQKNELNARQVSTPRTHS